MNIGHHKKISGPMAVYRQDEQDAYNTFGVHLARVLLAFAWSIVLVCYGVGLAIVSPVLLACKLAKREWR